MKKIVSILIMICIFSLSSTAFCNDRDFPVVRNSTEFEYETTISALDEHTEV